MSYAGGDVRTTFESDATVNLKKKCCGRWNIPQVSGDQITLNIEYTLHVINAV